MQKCICMYLNAPDFSCRVPLSFIRLRESHLLQHFQNNSFTFSSCNFSFVFYNWNFNLSVIYFDVRFKGQVPLNFFSRRQTVHFLNCPSPPIWNDLWHGLNSCALGTLLDTSAHPITVDTAKRGYSDRIWQWPCDSWALGCHFFVLQISGCLNSWLEYFKYHRMHFIF